MADRRGRIPRLQNRAIAWPLPSVDDRSIWDYADRWGLDRIDEVAGRLRTAAFRCAARGGDPHPALLPAVDAARERARVRRMGLSLQALYWPGPGPREAD